jgi:SAM-dependent methyltransferase
MTSTETFSANAAHREVNATVWGRGGYLWVYRRHRLRPAEAVLLERYRDELAGRVLELGCGGGRITGHLVPIASSLHGIDIASDMVGHCRRAFPRATFSEGDIRDLSALGTASADAVVAGFNVIDVLTHDERGPFFDEVHRILSPGGLVIFSSHNLASAPLVKGPLQTLSRNPVRAANRVARLPRSLRNRRRLEPMQRFETDYAIVNDVANDYALLHHYIARDGEERELAEHSFALLECLELSGAVVAPGQDAYGCHELHYAARRLEQGDGGAVASGAAASTEAPR